MEYKRLTKKGLENGEIHFVLDKNNKVIVDRKLFEEAIKIHKRLAELEDCPFCGGTSNLALAYRRGVSGYFVCCTKCEIMQMRPYKSKQWAIKNWNERLKMRNNVGTMIWLVKDFDANRHSFEDYNVLAYREDFIKKLKKKHKEKENFADELRTEMVYHYWCKCEYECIVEVDEQGRVFLSPWIGSGEKIDVTDNTDFDWKGFASEHRVSRRGKKIDIFDQIAYRWDEFVDYCWNYKHKWQRGGTENENKKGTDGV